MNPILGPSRPPVSERGDRVGSFRYSPERRTALVLSGTGVHGAYHAGVLRALQEAGVKIDIIAGEGIGALAAVVAAIDGAGRLWDAKGIWRSGFIPRLYEWKSPIRAAGWFSLLLALVLLLPSFLLGLGLVVYPVGFVLEMLALESGSGMIAAYSTWVQRAFDGPNLPTLVPRLAVIAMGGVLLALLLAALAGDRRTPTKRRARGGWWWRFIGAPIDCEGARHMVSEAVSGLIRGAAPADTLTGQALGRRYAEILKENVGQPGFRELMLVASDLDARRDIVAVLLQEPYRRDFMAPRPGVERQSEVLDLAGNGRHHTLDIVNAALTPPLVCDPYPLTFAPDSFWRGETHRCCQRPGAISRLLEELAAAGAHQAIIVSAVSPEPRPHHLRRPSLSLRGRAGEYLATTQSASLRDAMEMARLRFDAVYLIAPTHNPLGAFDVEGTYDEASDRRQTVVESMDRAWEDAYRQFIEPVVGASGEQLVRAGAATEPDRHSVGRLPDAESQRP